MLSMLLGSFKLPEDNHCMNRLTARSENQPLISVTLVSPSSKTPCLKQFSKYLDAWRMSPY